MERLTHNQLSELISAFVDGEVNEQESRLVARILEDDPNARTLFEELRRDRELLGSLPRHDAPSSVFTDVQAHIERTALLDDLHEMSDVRTFRLFRRLVPIAVAASLTFAAIGGWWYMGTILSPSTGDAESRVALEAREDASVAVDRALGMDGAESGDVPDPGDTRTFEDKLAANAPLSVLQSHAFAVEPLRLQVVVNNDSSRAALAAILKAQLASADLADLSISKESTTRAANSSGESGQFRARPSSVSDLNGAASEGVAALAEPAPADQGFFIQGLPGANFIAVNEDQILIRAPAEQVAAIIDRLPEAPDRSATVALQAGTLMVEGRERSQQLFRVLAQQENPAKPHQTGQRPAAKPDSNGLQSSAPAAKSPSARSSRRSSQPMAVQSEHSRDQDRPEPPSSTPTPEQKFLNDLLRGVGIDPELLAGSARDDQEPGAARFDPASPVVEPDKVQEPGSMVSRQQSRLKQIEPTDKPEDAATFDEARMVRAMPARGRPADKFVTLVIEISSTGEAGSNRAAPGSGSPDGGTPNTRARVAPPTKEPQPPPAKPLSRSQS